MGTLPRDTVLARLKAAGLLPRRNLGQHFLHDPRILDEIVQAAGLKPGDRVLEVGTGPATLTRRLARTGAEVLTVEIDRPMADFARRELSGLDRVRLIVADALDGRGGLAPQLRHELAAWERFHIVANLPYSISTAVLLALFEGGGGCTGGVVTVQREVAQRLVAKEGASDYGVATVLLHYWAEAAVVRSLPPGAFWPPPKVHSQVIRLVRRPSPLGAPECYDSYRFWCHQLLGHRRKQVGGLLRTVLGQALGAEGASGVLEAMGIEPRQRPEELSPDRYLHLAKKFPIRGLTGEGRSLEFRT